MAAYERVTLNRGGRNSRFDCSNKNSTDVGNGGRTKAHWDKSPPGQKPTGQYPTGQKPTA